jgi:hypothetical protein
MVRTTTTSLRAEAAAKALQAAARRTTVTPTASPPRRSPTHSPDDRNSPQLPVHPEEPEDPNDGGPGGNPGGNPGGDPDYPGDDDDLYGDVPGGGNPGGGGGGPPGDDSDEPEDDSDISTDDEEPPNLAVAINKLAKSVRRPSDSKTKVREPDTFDGLDPKKLRNFRVQCELNFKARTKAFRNDKSKVTYALSYLRGSALEWFEPSILDNSEPDWESDYTLFMDELQTNFGPFDSVGDAEVDLVTLRMGENHRYIKFIIIFNRLASEVDWNEHALRHSFYQALPNRIKDEMSHIERPTSLKGLKRLTQQIDARYWRRQEEIKRDNRSKTFSSSSQDKSGNNNNNKSSKNTSTSASSSAPKPSNSAPKSSSASPSSSRPGNGNTASQPKKPSEDLTGKLGKDGKLTTEERNRRISNNLCLFCGGTGHHASECKRAKARAARAAKTSESAETKSASDSSKK